MVEVLFIRARGPVAKVIAWWTGGVYCHCAIRLWHCIVLDIDALHGVRARFNPWKRRQITAIRYDMDPVKILAAVYASRWTSYSWVEGLRTRLWWLKDDRARWNCAEMVHDVILGGCDHALTPDGLYALMKGGDTIGS